MARPYAQVDSWLECLSPPEQVWCDQHASHCALVQHFVVMVRLDGEEPTPHAVCMATGHLR